MPTDGKTPEVDLKKWGSRIIDPGPLPANVSSLEISAQPIGVIIDAETIVRAHRAHGGPRAFNQLLLAAFKDAGAPVEGMAILKLSHGKVFKLKSRPGVFFFRYIWMPLERCAALGVSGEEKASLVN